MQVIASYLMYLPRLYITCLTLLSKFSQRERGRTYCINIQPTPFIKQRVYNQEKKVCNKMKQKNLYVHNNDNYLDEDVPIMCFDPCKFTFFCYYIIQVPTKSSGKFIFSHYFFDNVALLLRKHPWN